MMHYSDGDYPSPPSSVARLVETPRDMDTDSASEHGSIADSSYEIVSQAGTNDEDLTFIEDHSVSVPISRTHTPPARSQDGDVEDDYQQLSLSRLETLTQPIQDSDATPIGSLRLPAPEFITIQHRLSDSVLKLDRPFRIQYRGSLTYKDMIIEKVAQAIAVSNIAGDVEDTLSRFSVVQLSSFGEEKVAPQVTLIPSSGVELVVESFSPAPDSSETPASGELLTSPDLVVSFHSQPAETGKSIPTTPPRHESAPILNVAEAVGVDSGPIFEDGDLFMFVNKKKVAVNLHRFLDIKPLQLNQHIAYLIDRPRPQKILEPATERTFSAAQGFQYPWKEFHLEDYCDLQVVKCLIIAGLLMTAALSASAVFQAYQRPTHLESESISSSRLPITHALSSSTPHQERITKETRKADWFPGQIPSVSAVPQSAIISMDDAHSRIDDPPIELLHVKDWLYHVKMPNDVAFRRLPQLKVTASSNGKPLDLSLAKWNATVYSFELQPDQSNQPIDVFINFARSSRVYTYKLYPTSTWLAMKRLYKWVDQKSIEASIAACIATSKEVSMLASKEISLFRDQANGMVISSSAWLQNAIETARKASGSRATDIWQKFELQTVAMTKAVQKGNHGVADSVSKRGKMISESFERKVRYFKESTPDLTRSFQDARLVLEKRVKAIQRRFSDVGFPRSGQEPGTTFLTAQARAKAIIGQIQSQMMRARTDGTETSAKNARSGRNGKSQKRGCKGRH